MATGSIKSTKWKSIPISYSTTTGDIATGTITAAVTDNLLFLSATDMNRAAQTSAGSNMYAATITGLPDFYSGMMCTYAGSSAIIAALWNDGGGNARLEAKVTGAALAANTKATVRGFFRLS